MDERQLDGERRNRGEPELPAGSGGDSADNAREGRDELRDPGAASGTSQGDALRPLLGQDPSAIGGHMDEDGGTPIGGPADRTDVGPLHGGDQDPATGGSDLGPTTGGGDG